jgi:carbon-monoxide dehydrogenase small subunit
MDGDAVCACLVMAATAVNSEITTVEGITSESALTDVQQSFVEEGAVQCGFCTPGLIVAVHHLLDKNPTPSELEVKEAISGNICRCTGYGRVFAAVEATIRSRNEVK